MVGKKGMKSFLFLPHESNSKKSKSKTYHSQHFILLHLCQRDSQWIWHFFSKYSLGSLWPEWKVFLLGFRSCRIYSVPWLSQDPLVKTPKCYWTHMIIHKIIIAIASYPLNLEHKTILRLKNNYPGKNHTPRTQEVLLINTLAESRTYHTSAKSTLGSAYRREVEETSALPFPGGQSF